MSVILITGIPGSGKTLFAVSKLKKEIEKNIALPADEQRKIYCDITGLKIEDIPLPPIDWRETPPRSLVIYDEAQLRKEFKPHRGTSQYKFIEDLTIHRKTGHEIWFITQDPNRLHNDILAMVEQHYHLERPYGAKLATIFQYRGSEKFATRPTVKKRAERKSLFNYDKSLYELYESSQVDDGIKLRLPRELTMWIVIAVALAGLTYYYVTGEGTSKYVKAGMGKTAEKPKEQGNDMLNGKVAGLTPVSAVASTTAPTSTVASTTAPVYIKPPVSPEMTKRVTITAVMVFNGKCHATNIYGDKLNVSQSECMAYLNKTKSMHYSGADIMIDNKFDDVITNEVN